MRRGFVVIVLGLVCSCAASASARPAWPKPRAREIDGGESLAPRPAPRSIAAATVEDDRPSARAIEKPASPGVPVGPATAAPAAAAAAAASADDPVTAEDIVIEIEGDAP